MIRSFKEQDFTTVMNIWLNTNIQVHSFIPEKYWKDNFAFEMFFIILI